uniref:Uncharacterized protein n=1 Tax=Arundo donax TaxID=35708 RepID=A0A0A9BKK1_ARUDO
MARTRARSSRPATQTAAWRSWNRRARSSRGWTDRRQRSRPRRAARPASRMEGGRCWPRTTTTRTPTG